jgi:two-component system sensor histidine kinase KdpD
MRIFRQTWVGYGASLLAVALVSVLISLVEQRVHIAHISMLYLIAVLATASAFGRGPAVLASVAAFLTFNWFFVEPRATLTVSDPGEWVALVLFLITAVITGQLAAGQRRQAQEARQREREAMVLYDVVRLMGEPDLERALDAVANRLRLELNLAAVTIEVAGAEGTTTRAAVGEPEALQLAQHSLTTSPRALGQGASRAAGAPGPAGRWIRVVPPRAPGLPRQEASDRLHVVPVEAEGRRIGTLTLVSEPGRPTFHESDNRLLLAVATQLGQAVERARLRREATDAEVLRRSDELKTALLNAVSHDLRTPLASIIASAGSLRQKDVRWSEEDTEAFAAAIEQEAKRLNGIVGNLLDLSRIEASSLRPAIDWYDLGALIDDVLGRLRPLTARHVLTVDVPEDLPPVPLDYVQIDQVLTNLIENATKYTPAGGRIDVAIKQMDGWVEISVADRGRGIPPGALPRLFEPFYRVDGAGPRPIGTGLGLAVARGLVEAHGGKIWAENLPDGGARFVFSLPLTSATPMGRVPAEATR